MRYKKQNKKIGQKIKNFFVLFSIVICTAVFSIGVYNMYLGVDIYQGYVDNQNSVQKLSQSIEQVQETTIEDIIEQTMSCVVGISKIKNNGNSIFLKDGSSVLGLGTGVIVSENGYIITNQHVSGSKYANCYVTLENGKTYNGNVVWSDEDIDLSIVKINALGLNYIKLGDSDNIRVGQTVYAIGNPIGFEFQRTVTSRHNKCSRQNYKTRGR